MWGKHRGRSESDAQQNVTPTSAAAARPQQPPPAPSESPGKHAQSAPAPAPPIAPDDRYIAALTESGITINNRENAIITAHSVCTMLSEGWKDTDIEAQIIESNPTFSPDIARATVNAAVSVYSPGSLWLLSER